jgi:hypothetical protein
VNFSCALQRSTSPPDQTSLELQEMKSAGLTCVSLEVADTSVESADVSSSSEEDHDDTEPLSPSKSERQRHTRSGTDLSKASQRASAALFSPITVSRKALLSVPEKHQGLVHEVCSASPRGTRSPLCPIECTSPRSLTGLRTARDGAVENLPSGESSTGVSVCKDVKLRVPGFPIETIPRSSPSNQRSSFGIDENNTSAFPYLNRPRKLGLVRSPALAAAMRADRADIEPAGSEDEEIEESLTVHSPLRGQRPETGGHESLGRSPARIFR